MSVGMIALLHFILQQRDCVMRSGEYIAVSVKRCVLLVHYESSGNPLPSPLAEEYMDQKLKKKKKHYSIIHLMRSLHPSYHPTLSPFSFLS